LLLFIIGKSEVDKIDYIEFNNPNKVNFDVAFNIPLQRAHHFVGRADAMNELHRAVLYNDGDVHRAMTKTVVVTGIGGIGKSQLVIEFIHTYREKFQSVLWINCASKASILSDFEGAAQELKANFRTNAKGRKLISDFESTDIGSKRQSAAVKLVLLWLSQPKNSHWLVVFDGLDQLDDLELDEYIPQGDAGNIIITSRNTIAESYAGNGRGLRLDVLSPENALLLLLQSAGVGKSLDHVSDGT
jgi:hypothetical protein